MKTPLRLAALVGAVAIVAAACGGGATPSPSESAAPSAAPESSAPASQAPTGLAGELTVWHSYGSGGGEAGALNEVLAKVQADNPDLKLTVLDVPFQDIFNKYQTDVAAGGGPDLYIAPNDNLFTQADAGLLEPLDTQLAERIKMLNPVAVEGSKVNGVLYMVPQSLKAVAMWYDKSAIASAPKTTDELLAAVKDGSVKLAINQNVYHNFGFSGAFGGKLMDENGKSIADQGGWADAFKYLADLKAAGAQFFTDGNAAKDAFQTGKVNAIIDGPWQTADFRKALGDKLAVTPMPAGPGGPSNPLTGVDGWYINPNGKSKDLAIQFALLMTDQANNQVFVDKAGHVPVDPMNTISDPITQGFADAAATGFPRPQRAEFNNYWGPFGDALSKVIDTGADPVQAIADATKLMNEANKK